MRIPNLLPLDKAAPLLCTGITTYSPLRHWQVKKGDVKYRFVIDIKSLG